MNGVLPLAGGIGVQIEEPLSVRIGGMGPRVRPLTPCRRVTPRRGGRRPHPQQHPTAMYAVGRTGTGEGLGNWYVGVGYNP